MKITAELMKSFANNPSGLSKYLANYGLIRKVCLNELKNLGYDKFSKFEKLVLTLYPEIESDSLLEFWMNDFYFDLFIANKVSAIYDLISKKLE